MSAPGRSSPGGTRGVAQRVEGSGPSAGADLGAGLGPAGVVIGASVSGSGAEGRAAIADRKITAAVLAMLVREGPARVTIESVAAESGVAKTTIYRRYANTEAMVDDVLERSRDSLAPRPLELPAGGTWTQQQWTHALDAAVRSLVQDLGTGTAVALLSEPTSEVARILRSHLVRPRIEQLHGLLRLQVDAGGLRPETDLEVVIDFVLGSAYVRLAREGELGEDWAQRVRDALLGQLGR